MRCPVPPRPPPGGRPKAAPRRCSPRTAAQARFVSKGEHNSKQSHWLNFGVLCCILRSKVTPPPLLGTYPQEGGGLGPRQGIERKKGAYLHPELPPRWPSERTRENSEKCRENCGTLQENSGALRTAVSGHFSKCMRSRQTPLLRTGQSDPRRDFCGRREV